MKFTSTDFFNVKKIYERLTGRHAAVLLLIVFSVCSVAMACAGATRALDCMKYYAAIGVVAAFAACSALACLRSWRRASVLLLHAGFALVLGGWVYNEFSGPEDGFLRLRPGQTGRVAENARAEGFNLTVRDFSISRWPDTGTVRQYTCLAEVEPDGNPRENVTIDVNHPLVKCGWWVYQSSYEELQNPHTGKPLYFTILQCVKDVGLPFAAAGGLLILLGAFGYAASRIKNSELRIKNSELRIKNEESRIQNSELRIKNSELRIQNEESSKNSELRIKNEESRIKNEESRINNEEFRIPNLIWKLYALACAGAIAMLVHRGVTTGHPPMQNMYEFLMCSAALIPVLTFFARRERHALLVDAVLLALVMIPVAFVMDGKVKRLMPALQSPFFVPHVGSYVLGYILLVRAAFGTGRKLTGFGFFLLTSGLVLGAAWGKVCWGHWWQFDPKEMWSLATWFVYAAYFHLRTRLSPRAENAFLAIGAIMIVLTLTWINLSRIFTGMHSYA